ncbi:MAG: group I truncated hemoglobin [Planctomycetaceae bacterium]
MTATESHDTVYERLGGAEGVRHLLVAFYGRVLGDPLLAPFFEHVTMARLVRMQEEFFATALGGPHRYSGAELTHVHAGRGIHPHHFAAFCQHLGTTLQAVGVGDADVREVLDRILALRKDIVGTA